MFRKSVDFFVNAQVDPKKVMQVQVALNKRNHVALQAFSILAMVGFGVASLAGLFSDINGITQKVIGYFSGFALSCIVFFLNRFVAFKRPRILPALLFTFEASLYATGMYLTFICTPNQLTITLFAVFLAVPQFFAERPRRVNLLTLATVIVFVAIYLLTDLKPVAIRKQEFVDLGIFAALGIVLGSYVKKALLERFIFEHREQQVNGKERQMQIQQWKSLADIYVSMVQADLDTDKFMVMRTNEYIQKAISSEQLGFKKNLTDVMTATTAPEFLNGVLEFIDVTTLRNRLKNKRTITHEFMGVNFGWCRARFIAVRQSGDEELNRVIYVVENINDQKNREARLTTMAETDAMTGLYNRQAGTAKIKELLYNNREGMLCLFDVDKFKSVNDNFGHQTGDEVIIATAKALRKAFRDNDVLMRLGGDEFVVYATDVKTEEVGARVIQRFFSILDETRIAGHEDYRISVSLGATFAHEESMFETLYKQADDCTYESKKILGKSFTFHRG